jgi:DNA-directed RNA polymerase specialized sigma24 family protein
VCPEECAPAASPGIDADHDWGGLMARAQDGDADAYFTLLHQITPYLRAAICRGWMDERDIESVVQDVLLTMHAVRHTYDPACPFEPWLLDIANCRPLRRQRRRRSVTELVYGFLFRRLIRVAAGRDESVSSAAAARARRYPVRKPPASCRDAGETAA